jgi:RHS repeat-associated protein
VALTNSSGVIKEAYDTDAYGNTLCYSAGGGTGGAWFSNSDTTTVQPACETIFTGREYDPETQIYFYRARYYSPQLGRFISRDSFEFEDGPNLFEYVRSNPVIAFDPYGLWTASECYAGFIKPLAATALKEFKQAAYKCVKKGIFMPPKGGADAFRECMLDELKGAAEDALAKYACCLLDTFVIGGQSTDPEDRTKSAVNCMQVCDWRSCQDFAKDPTKKKLVGLNFSVQTCYTKCNCEADWTKW